MLYTSLTIFSEIKGIGKHINAGRNGLENRQARKFRNGTSLKLSPKVGLVYDVASCRSRSGNSVIEISYTLFSFNQT